MANNFKFNEKKDNIYEVFGVDSDKLNEFERDLALEYAKGLTDEKRKSSYTADLKALLDSPELHKKYGLDVSNPNHVLAIGFAFANSIRKFKAATNAFMKFKVKELLHGDSFLKDLLDL